MAPDHIDLVYRKVGENHVFASKGIDGLVHVGHADLHEAYTMIFKALSFHVTNTYRVAANYVCETQIEELEQKILAGGSFAFVRAARESSSMPCH